MIVVRNVTKTYSAERRVAVTAVSNVSMTVDDGDFVVIQGPPGSGKTTLINIMAGLTTPTAGVVLYDGVEVWNLPDPQQSLFRNRHVGFVFQFPSLMPSLTVLENVLLPTIFLVDDGDAGERARRGMALLGEVGLDDRMAAYPRQLSASLQQRLVIARALVNRPQVLFADEPATGLDQQAEHDIMALLEDIQRRLKVTIVLVTPSSHLGAYGKRVFGLAAGQLVEPVQAGVR